MPVQPARRPVAAAGDLRRRAERLDWLPLRPWTARQVLDSIPDEPADWPPLPLDLSTCRAACDLDPGWILGECAAPRPFDALRWLEDRSWWPANRAAGALADVFQRLWRHSVAVSIATRVLAREAGDPDPDHLVRAGLLHGLGRWAIAAVDAQWLARWIQAEDLRARREMEFADLGTDLCDLGRSLAERWGCDPLVVEAAWLHDQSNPSLNRMAVQPERLALIQEAVRWAECTPWSLAPGPPPEALPGEPRLRILIAEVQSRCAALFVAPDATAHEERASRRNARLARRLAETLRTSGTQRRLLEAIASAQPHESPVDWAGRAGMLWCAEPEVNAARVAWAEDPIDPATESSTPEPGDRDTVPAPAPAERPAERAPTHRIPLVFHGRKQAEIGLWCEGAEADLLRRLESSSILPAWQAWASQHAERTLLERRLRAVVAAVRQESEREEAALRSAKLDALAEFAAGAGHELNNPLAVIVGRAQLLLARAEDAETIRSLRIILGQAQRTHRILRDLMFVARPAAPRARPCRPAEILRACVSGVREECADRGIQIFDEIDPGELTSLADPDALNHLADTLIGNAIQATPAGGRIEVRSQTRDGELWWSVSDTGKGISPTEGSHLFDPFYCGRQAGRGLGLGLPRAARMVAMAGGTLDWSSTPRTGSRFEVRLPLASAQRPASQAGSGEPPSTAVNGPESPRGS